LPGDQQRRRTQQHRDRCRETSGALLVGQYTREAKPAHGDGDYNDCYRDEDLSQHFGQFDGFRHERRA
jgi:hypothetical protein